MKLFRSSHPDEVTAMDTPRLRERFLIDSIFEPGKLRMNYVQDDRIIVGGIAPLVDALVIDGDTLSAYPEITSLREFGVINLGGPGRAIAGEEEYALARHDGLYIGRGHERLVFTSNDAENPARFYVASTPAHTRYDTVHIPFANTNPLHLGEADRSNVRTIHQYVHPKVCQSAQLLMGMTLLADGSLWNTMPCHTHDRRMEVYFYFDLPEAERVFHFMGETDQTRHLVVQSEQGVIAPSWSIHTGVGTASYNFIWSMAGENQVFEDMDGVATAQLR